MVDDYSEYPKSLTERKSDATNNASHTTPRDVLIQMLRKIDSGEESPSVLLVLYAEYNAKDGACHTGFITASPNIHLTLGLIESAKHQQLTGGTR